MENITLTTERLREALDKAFSVGVVTFGISALSRDSELAQQMIAEKKTNHN